MYDRYSDQQLRDLCFFTSRRLLECNRQLEEYFIGERVETEAGWLYRLYCSIKSLTDSLNITSCEIRRRELRFNEILLELIEKRVEGEKLRRIYIDAQILYNEEFYIVQ